MKHSVFLLLLLSACSPESGEQAPGNPTYNPEAQLYVEGSMIDIRKVQVGEMVYPQNDEFTFSAQNASVLGTGRLYATSLREYRGVERVRADYPTTLQIAMIMGTDPGAEWTAEKTRFQIGSFHYQFYSLLYDTPGKWVEIPSGGAAATLVFGKKFFVNGVPDPPGIIIARTMELRKRNISNPSIMILDDGSYFAGSSGPNPKGNTYFRSTDKGRTWERLSNPDYMNFCKCFTRPSDRHTLYEVGVSTAKRGNIVIRKSEDRGRSWSALTTLFKGDYHGAPTPYVEYEKRIWHAMGTSPETGKMGIAVLSIAQDADPMRKENWTLTNVLEGGPNSWFAGSGVTHDTQRSFNQWQEGCIVPDPEGRLTIVTRIDESSWSDVAALIRVVDEHTITFDPATDFIDMPGGGKKFTIHYDGQSRKYWTLVNPCYDEDRRQVHSGWYRNRINPLFLRSRLVLCSSPDLRKWTVEKEVISSNNSFFHGFQYVDWVFDGDDIIAVSRTAFPETRGLPNRQHDANFLTFHRIPNFRNAGFETIRICCDQL